MPRMCSSGGLFSLVAEYVEAPTPWIAAPSSPGPLLMVGIAILNTNRLTAKYIPVIYSCF